MQNGQHHAISWRAIILFGVVMYVLLIRPQSKRQKEHKTMIDQLKRGDRVVTAGGLIGTISRVQGENEVVIEIASEVEVRVIKSTIAQVLTKGVEKSGSGESKIESPTKTDNDKASKKPFKKPLKKGK